MIRFALNHQSRRLHRPQSLIAAPRPNRLHLRQISLWPSDTPCRRIARSSSINARRRALHHICTEPSPPPLLPASSWRALSGSAKLLWRQSLPAFPPNDVHPRYQPVHPFRIPQRKFLRDHSAHRNPENPRPLNSRRVQYLRRIVRHLLDTVWPSRNIAFSRRPGCQTPAFENAVPSPAACGTTSDARTLAP